MGATETELYYDPYDFEIDADPYPVWQRLREEAPLYCNEKYDFCALSRFDDVERGLVDWKTYSSARGTVLEIIKLDIEMPPGLFIFEDPPDHDLHRGLLTRVFTPRRMAAIEPKVREFCARSLDPLVGTGGFDFVRDLGAQMPMRTIGMLLGIPEEDQEAIRGRDRRGVAPAGRRAMPRNDGGSRRGEQLRRLHRLASRAPVRRPDDRAAPGRVRGRDRHTGAASPARRCSATSA